MENYPKYYTKDESFYFGPISIIGFLDITLIKILHLPDVAESTNFFWQKTRILEEWVGRTLAQIVALCPTFEWEKMNH